MDHKITEIGRKDKAWTQINMYKPLQQINAVSIKLLFDQLCNWYCILNVTWLACWAICYKLWRFEISLITTIKGVYRTTEVKKGVIVADEIARLHVKLFPLHFRERICQEAIVDYQLNIIRMLLLQYYSLLREEPPSLYDKNNNEGIISNHWFNNLP